MSTAKECRVCRGSRHRWDEAKKVYVSCVCLKKKRQLGRYRGAGIPTRYDSETWRSWAEEFKVKGARKLLKVAKELARGEQPEEWILVHGHPTRARSLASSLLLRSACDGAWTAMGVDVPTLIDAEFQPGKGSDIYEVPVLSVLIGGEPANKWNRVILEKLLYQRWEQSRFTLLVVDGDPSRVAGRYKSASVAATITDKFYWVRVTPKDEA